MKKATNYFIKRVDHPAPAEHSFYSIRRIVDRIDGVALVLYVYYEVVSKRF